MCKIRYERIDGKGRVKVTFPDGVETIARGTINPDYQPLGASLDLSQFTREQLVTLPREELFRLDAQAHPNR